MAYAEAEFDMIDLFIARYHIDPEVAPEAMAIPAAEIARMLVDMNVPRTRAGAARSWPDAGASSPRWSPS